MKEDNKKVISNSQIGEILKTRLLKIKEENFETPWFKNYRRPQNVNGRYYKGSNAAILALLCENKNYQTGIFLTHKQIQDEGIRIIKGEKSCYLSGEVYKYSKSGKEDNLISYSDFMDLPDSEKKAYKRILITSYYSVFNIEQTDFPVTHKESWEMMCEKYSIEQNTGDNYIHPALHSIIKDQKWICPIEISNNLEPGYSWNQDKIITRPLSSYLDVRTYYDDMLLYMSNSTGHPLRLHREFNNLGDERYKKESLISSLTSAIIGSELGMSIKPQREFKLYVDLWINEIENNPSYGAEILKSSAQSQYIINNNIKEEINSLTISKKNQSLDNYSDNATAIPELELPKLTEFKKENAYVYAIGTRSDGIDFKSLIYRRGTEYCYMLGSIIDGDLSTHFLDESQKDIYLHIKETKTDSRVFLSDPEKIITEADDNIFSDVSISTPRRSLDIKDNKATITYRDIKYDATTILDTFRKHGISINTISSEEWKRLLLGQGIQLGNTNKAIFSIRKTPSGYGLKVMNEIIKQDKAELVK